MAASPSQTTIARHWELLKLLPSHAPGMEARVLTQQLSDVGFAVSKRTVERDLQELSAIFPICCNDKSIPYGWYWLTGAGLQVPALSVTEALSLALVESQVRQLLPAPLLGRLAPLFSQANQKLNALKPQLSGLGAAEKFASVTPAMSLLAPQLDGELLRQLQQAVLDEKQLEVRYHALHQNRSKNYRLHPLAMVQRGAIGYLIATVDGFTEPRRFAVHRFLHVTQTDDAAQIPPAFHLSEYLAGGAMAFSDGQQLKIELEVSPTLASLLAETPLSPDMVLQWQDKGHAMVTATVHRGWQLNHWLLSHAHELTVLAPAAVRDQIKQKLIAALCRYE